MRVSTSIYLNLLGKIVPPFIALAGIEAWEKRWTWIKSEMKRCPILEHTLAERYGLELAVERLRRRYRVTRRWPKKLESPTQSEVLALVALAVRIHRELSATGQNHLRGMVRDAVQSGLGPLAHELSMAAHFMRCGFDVEFIDLEGKGNFEYVIRRGAVEADVECKRISYDRGRKVHRRDFEKLVCELQEGIASFLRSDLGSGILRLRLAGRLPSGGRGYEEIKQAVQRVLEDGGPLEGDFGAATLDLLKPGGADVVLAKAQETVATDTDWHCFVVWDATKTRAIAIAVSSDKDDDILRGIRAQMKKAATQLSGERPGYILVYLEEIEAHEWNSLRMGSALQRVTEEFLVGKEHRSHVHSIAYMSRTEVRQVGVGHWSDSSPLLAFRNPDHRRVHDPDLDLTKMRPVPRQNPVHPGNR